MRCAVAYLWAAPATVLGLVLLLLAYASGGRIQRHQGVLEVTGGWPARLLSLGFPWAGRVAALTLGHVVIAVSDPALAATRAHERAHVRQFERWGALMLVLYPVAGVWAGLRGGHPYRDNFFERQACEEEMRVEEVPGDQSTGR